MNMHEKLQVAASSVPASASTAAAAGLHLDDWMKIATIAWIGIQVFFFVYDRIKRRKHGKESDRE